MGIAASAAPSATASSQTTISKSSSTNVISTIIAATSPAGASGPEASQVSIAVLSSLSAAGFSISSINVQVTAVGSSTAPTIGSSGETAESGFPAPSLNGGDIILSTVAIESPNGAGSSSFQAITTAENTGNSPTSAIGLGGVIQASAIPATPVASIALSPTFSSSGVNIEASPAGSALSGELDATIIPSLAAEQSAGPAETLAVGSSEGQIPAAGQPAPSASTPIIVANGTTALAVIPSPIVGANGLTSLAVFSTPIAPAAGLTTPAVLLTPIVGANGLTSLAVVATPIVGANGLTSLAIGFETETTPATSQSNTAPSPIEGFVVVQPPAFAAQVSGSILTAAHIAASGVANVLLPSGPTESPVSGGSGSGNNSIHVLLSPTAAIQFQGSAIRLSLSHGVGFLGLMAFFVLL